LNQRTARICKPLFLVLKVIPFVFWAKIQIRTTGERFREAAPFEAGSSRFEVGWLPQPCAKYVSAPLGHSEYQINIPNVVLNTTSNCINFTSVNFGVVDVV
jgi:hypothetical protein